MRLFVPMIALAMTACPGPTSTPDGGPAVDAGPAGLTWHRVVNAYDPGAVLAVWSDGPENVWMVGGEPGSGFALQFDGETWTQHDPGTGDSLGWVHGWDDGRVMVVGARGGASLWDGETWTVLDTGVPGATLYGVWGLRSDSVWAVGGPQTDPGEGVEPQTDVLLHFDGQTWTRQAVPERAEPGIADALYKVWGTDEETVFIVGTGGRALHLHRDGWSERVTPAGQGILFTTMGRAHDEVYAVGGMGSAIMLRWDGRVWSDFALPSERPTSLPGIWTAPDAPLWIAGARGFTARHDENGWTTEWVDTAQSFHAVHFDGQRIWAVGGDIDARRADHIGAIFCSEPVPAP